MRKEPIDWNKALMHASIVAFLMSEGKEKSPRQLWEDAVDDLSARQAKYDAMTDRIKTMASGIKAWGKIEELKFKVAELDKNKDDEPLSKTAKSYLKKYYAYLKYGKWSAMLDKGNKYTNKGKMAEPDSIELVSFLDDRPYSKNTVRLVNEYLTGEPDIIVGDDPYNAEYIIDVKTSYDIETFIENLGKDLNPMYWWQIMAYFALTGANIGEVSYCLVNTPEILMNQEKVWLLNRMDAATNLNPEYMEAERILVNNLTFTDIPHADRRIKFIVERDDEAIEKMYKRIDKAREYLAEVERLHSIGSFKAISPKTIELEEAA